MDRGLLKEKDREPDINPYYYYMECFFELGTCRNQDGPIPFTAIHHYANVYNEYDFDEFLYIIRLLDDVYLNHRMKKLSKDTPNASKQSNKKN